MKLIEAYIHTHTINTNRTHTIYRKIDVKGSVTSVNVLQLLKADGAQIALVSRSLTLIYDEFCS